MLLRLFDREDLQLIPIGRVRRAAAGVGGDSPRAAGRRPRASSGSAPTGTGSARRMPPQRGLAPYYNVLHPRVQQAMLGVLRELAERYAQHPSFAGLAVRLSADGYAQLPGPDWGLDDATIARVRARHEAARAGQRAATLRRARGVPRPGAAAPDVARVARPNVAKFYRRAARRTCGRPARQPPLSGRGRHDRRRRSCSGSELRPLLAAHAHSPAAVRVGIDARHYQAQRAVSCCCGRERIAPRRNSAPRRTSKSARWPTSTAISRASAVPGSLFFHPPRESPHVESFDQKSPFKPSYTWLVSQPAPSGSRTGGGSSTAWPRSTAR